MFNVQVMVGQNPAETLNEQLVYLDSRPDTVTPDPTTVTPSQTTDVIIGVVVTVVVVSLIVIILIIILITIFCYVRSKKKGLYETTEVEL